MARAALAVALLGCVVGTSAVALRAQRVPAMLTTHWQLTTLDLAPPAWLVVAAVLVLRDRTPARHAVLTAALLVLVLRGLDLCLQLFTRGGGYSVRPQHEWLAYLYLHTCRAPVLLAVTALVPAVVGWWQRRQDRLADPDAEG